jgi:ribosome biogenesis GTPase A
LSLLDTFIEQYNTLFKQEEVTFDDTLTGYVKSIKYKLLDEKYNPSIDLERQLNHLEQRTVEPMKVAITGQFSSGKSTFLNALLAKDILPTGVTPVTSKVNYIRYGDDFRLKVVFNNGSEEFHSIENIKSFTDQRGKVEDIAYLTLYAPLEILKEVVFVDTPGLNSQSDADTQVTQKVLEDVDGIIWLTLIDNAGKQSEVEVLEEYINKYSSKSLCVLNQKDKYSKEQVSKTINYVEEKFDKYFSQVIAISSLQALNSRSCNKASKLNKELEEFSKNLNQKLKQVNVDDDFISTQYEAYKQKVQTILSSDITGNIQLLEESNINKVLDFINEQIRPQALSSKQYAIQKEVEKICDILIEQNKFFISVHDEIKDLITSLNEFASEFMNEIQTNFTKKLKTSFTQIENIVDTIANEIYANIITKTKTRYVKKPSILGKKQKFEKVSYDAYAVDQDKVYKKLFYDDEVVHKLFKKYDKNIKEANINLQNLNEELYKKYETTLKNWKTPYEFIRKPNPLYSGLEFANIRRFASKVYELFLKSFNDERRKTLVSGSVTFEYISTYIKAVYETATSVCISYIEKNIEDSCTIYEKDPAKFSIAEPTLEEIKQKLRLSFNVDTLESLMSNQRNFVFKLYKDLNKQFKDITQEKVEYLEELKDKYFVEIEELVKQS